MNKTKSKIRQNMEIRCRLNKERELYHKKQTNGACKKQKYSVYNLAKKVCNNRRLYSSAKKECRSISSEESVIYVNTYKKYDNCSLYDLTGSKTSLNSNKTIIYPSKSAVLQEIIVPRVLVKDINNESKLLKTNPCARTVLKGRQQPPRKDTNAHNNPNNTATTVVHDKIPNQILEDLLYLEKNYPNLNQFKNLNQTSSLPIEQIMKCYGVTSDDTFE